MLCRVENKHGKIWVKNLIGNNREYSKFCFKSWNKHDIKAFRDFINAFHHDDYDTTNKIVGDLLHHGVGYQFNGVRDEI